ncbi:hypothetical protein QE152_g33988 [Popillia japonica]|uniref:Uncharacterized protein n=1 Tax=Popillia japonica TaxID=7064 RepID=A0AAW1IVF6_POPJA
MSISTRNSHRPQGQSFFTPRSRPTFVSQELFNTETHEEDPVDYPTETNSEVFGKPKQTQPLPTPMSISTRNSHRPQGQSFFTPRSRPTFVSQELFNTETHEEDPVDYPTEPMLEAYYYQEEQYDHQEEEEEQYDHQEEEVEDPQNFRSPTQQTENTYKNISYPILSEYGISDNINFHVLKWHDRFDALLGSHDFQQLGAKIDYQNRTLEINNKRIPFFIELNPQNFEPFYQTVNNVVSIPVNIEQGEVVIPEMNIGDICIPESLAYANANVPITFR